MPARYPIIEKKWLQVSSIERGNMALAPDRVYRGILVISLIVFDGIRTYLYRVGGGWALGGRGGRIFEYRWQAVAHLRERDALLRLGGGVENLTP